MSSMYKNVTIGVALLICSHAAAFGLSRNSEISARLLSKNNLTCDAINRILVQSFYYGKKVGAKQNEKGQLFEDYVSGDRISIRIPAEELLDAKYITGEYIVGQNSSVRLNDGQIVYRDNQMTGINNAIKRYLLRTYGYRYVVITSSNPPKVDYVVKGEVPMQSFLKSKKSNAASSTEDSQINIQAGDQALAPNSLKELLRERRILTAYSDPKCILVFRARSNEMFTVDASDFVSGVADLPYTPIYNNDIVYIPLRSGDPTVEYSKQFARTPFASDIQISITGWGSKPKVLSAPSGTTLFELLSTNDVLLRGYSDKITIYRYDPTTSKFVKLKIRYPSGASTFVPRDKDIVSVGKDEWSASLATINEVTSPLVTALSSFFFFTGAAAIIAP